MRNSEAAFKWIISLLQELKASFVIVGGLAANAHGTKRNLADIDIDVPKNVFDELIPQVKEYIVFGPSNYCDNEFDIELMTLNYEGQEIDLTVAETIKLYDKNISKWVSRPTNPLAVTEIEIFGIAVPVMKKDLLVGYKKMIARDTDIQDVVDLGG